MLNPDFRDILSEFSAAQVEFMLVGAYALAAQASPARQATSTYGFAVARKTLDEYLLLWLDSELPSQM